ncbi:MAG: hypothetical protein M1549_03965, partial [Candidatus Dependentiae bacterium]|nr:hypothetical protein [Candidatus Dependentiae bacterium]
WNAMANIKGTEITEEELRKVLDAQLLNGNMFKSLGQGALDAALWAPRKAWAFVNWASFGHPWLGLGATATALAGAQAFGTFTTHSNFAPTTWGKGAKVGRLAKIKNAVTTKIEKGLNDVEQFASTHPKIMSNVVSPILTGVGFSAAEHVLFPTVTSGLNMTKSSFNTAFNKGKGAASWTVGKGYDIACGGKNIAGKVWSKLPSLRKTTNGKQPVGK